jgi:SNF2-related domain
VSLVVRPDGAVLALTPTSYDEANRITVYRDLPSARWNKARQRWEMPHTRGALARLHEAAPRLRGLDSTALMDGLAPLPRVVPGDDAPPFPTPTRTWRHQCRAYWFLDAARAGLGAALLDCGMRTGKTKMVLDHLRGLPVESRRAVVFAPNTVVPVWPEQRDRHVDDGAKMPVIAVVDGSVAARVERIVDLLASGDPVVAVVGWSVLERLTTEQKRALRSALADATVVADEVHYAKAPGSARSESLAYISRLAAFRVGASGTPLSHSPLDAYAIFRFLDPGVWGTSYARFRETYAVTGGYAGHQVVGYRNLDDLSSRMAPYTFRVTRDVLELPDAQHVDVPIVLPPAARRVYNDLRDEGVAELVSGRLTIANSLAMLTRLAQVASGYLPAADGSGEVEELHREKRAALHDLLESCDPSEPWVVFARFHHDLDSIIAAASDARRPVHELSGRRKELDAWRADCRAGRGPVLAAQIQSGGIGISLVEAAFCAYYSVGYSLSEWQQSLARVHGPEQTRPVAYYHLVARGTVDVLIRRAIEKRADVVRYVAESLVAAQRGEAI